MSMTACIPRVVGTDYKDARDLLAGDVRHKTTFALNIAGIDVLYHWVSLFNNLQMQLLYSNYYIISIHKQIATNISNWRQFIESSSVGSDEHIIVIVETREN